MRVGQSLAVTIGLLLVFAMVGIGLALLASAQLNDRRQFLLEEIGPSLRAAIKLEDALVNEETGVRGFVITGQPSSLEPYRRGVSDGANAYRELHLRERSTGPQVASEVEAVRSAANAWRERYVEPTLRDTARSRRRSARQGIRGKALFDAVRRPLELLQADLQNKDSQTRRQLEPPPPTSCRSLLLVAGALIIGGVLGAGCSSCAAWSPVRSRTSARKPGASPAADFTSPLASRRAGRARSPRSRVRSRR